MADGTLPCKKCGKPVEQKVGKKAKQFCSAECRQKQWQADQRELRKRAKQAGIKIGETVIVNQPSALNENEVILKQIEAIRKETVPYYRDTPMGRRTWSEEQQKRIVNLESKLKNQ